MKMLSWTAAFFSGVFLANAVPHFVNGISGNPFPSPFGDPPGFGSSSPLSNVLWGGFNLLLGFSLARLGKVELPFPTRLATAFAGAMAMGCVLSQAFAGHH